MSNIVEWIDKRQYDPSHLLLFLLGAVLVLLGITTHLELPFVSTLVPEATQRITALASGIALVLLSTALRARKIEREQDYVPRKALLSVPSSILRELTLSFIDKRDSLTGRQRQLLMTMEHMGAGGDPVSLNTIAKTLGDGHSLAEAHYRMEQLRLLGFIRLDPGHFDAPLDMKATISQRFVHYSLSEEYQKSKLPTLRSSSTFYGQTPSQHTDNHNSEAGQK